MRDLATAAASLAALALASCSEAPRDKSPIGIEKTVEDATTVTTMTKITIEDPWIQLPAVQGRPGAAYFTFRLEGTPDKLLSVTTPIAERTAMHESRAEAGVTRMAPVDDLSLEEGKPLGFAPGTKHVMLFGIDPAVKAGSNVPLTFTFARTAPITAQAEVRAFGEGNGAD